VSPILLIHLPAGCSIQLDKVSRKYVLDNIRTNLRNLATQVPERLQTFASETGQELTFGNFVRYHEYEPEQLLVAESWTSWKSRAQLASWIYRQPSFFERFDMEYRGER
jgi:hypothetical protein